jgi:MscS family membrane protein
VKRRDVAEACRVTVLIALTLLARASYGQLPVPATPTPPPAAAPKPVEEDAFGRDNPRGCALGFLKAVGRQDYQQAAQYLDWRTSPKAQELAEQLEAVLNHGLTNDIQKLSRAPEGDLKDGLPPNRERVGSVETPSGKLDIFLDRIQRRTGPPIWLFSSDTLREVPDAFEELNSTGPERFLPGFLREHKIFFLPLWRWLFIIVALVLAVLSASLVTRGLIPLLRAPIRRMTGHTDDRYLLSLTKPIRLLLVTIAIRFLAREAVDVLARVFWTHVSQVLMVAGLAWLVIKFSDVISEFRSRQLFRSGATNQIGVLALAHRLFNVLVLFVAIAFLLHQAGVNVSAMLAGLGIGGIALALAAQKTLEDVFGGLTLVTRKAVRVGDFCQLGGQMGTIEEIGLGSTRVRTLDNTVVTIPNGKVAQMSLENYSMRQKIWFHQVFGLRSDTSPDQMRQVLTTVTRLLQSDTRVEKESARIRLIAFGASSLQVEIFAYMKTTDYAKFLEIQEDLMLRIMDTIAGAGTSMALPSQITYLDQRNGRRADERHLIPDNVEQSGAAGPAGKFLPGHS